MTTDTAKLAGAGDDVDAAGRATVLRPLSLSSPHTRAFHLAWLSLFACFFSAFAAAPLLPVLRPALLLSPADVSSAAVASLSGTLIGRLSMGFACDLLGPRFASVTASLLTAAALALAASLAPASPAGFIVLRFVAGLSLANFVSNQYWMSSIFAPATVGLANAVAAGWANVGSAAAQVAMPAAYTAILRAGVHLAFAWRFVFLLPAAFQAATALAVLHFTGDEKPRRSRKKTLAGDGLRNYRGWVLGLTYGYCYGVELTMENVAAAYFHEKFGLGFEAAGAAAASFGAMNAVARPAGGVLSDAAGERFGMRGRLWALWAVQTAGGLLCMAVGGLRTESLPATVAAVVVFAAFVQAASGLTYGVVPFVSKRSLGVISGMTGSGGALGAIVTQLLFFSNSGRTTEEGISQMGIAIIVCTLAVTLIYFPRWGGMLCGPSADDQLAVAGDEDAITADGIASGGERGDYEMLK